MIIEKIVRMAGVLIIVVVIAFLIKAALGNSLDNNNAPTEQNTGGNDIQEVTLSWGKFNYNPEVIRVKANTPVRITADTVRLQGCFRAFVSPGLGLQKYFNENDKTLVFTPTNKGTFGFSCSMGMGKGTIIVE